jgi:hypothetical protein
MVINSSKDLHIHFSYELIMRIAFPMAVILISGGFFTSAIGKSPVTPNRLIWLSYCGITVLPIAVTSPGIG